MFDNPDFETLLAESRAALTTHAENQAALRTHSAANAQSLAKIADAAEHVGVLAKNVNTLIGGVMPILLSKLAAEALKGAPKA